MKLQKVYPIVLLAVLTLAAQGCHWWPEFGIPANQRPWGEFNPIKGMHTGPDYPDQKPGGMLYPAVHSQPMHYKFDDLQKDERDLAKKLRNPVIMTEESVAYGKKMYERTCIVCHGADGLGHGNVIGPDKFNAKLPSLIGEKVVALSDGEIYHTITHGYGIMFSYKSQLKPTERWAVINYIRAMQRAGNPKPSDGAE